MNQTTMWWPGKNFRDVHCPDGSTKRVYNNVNKHFPLVEKDSDKSAAVTISALESLRAQLQGQASQRVGTVITAVDSANATLQVSLRAVYTAVYSPDPCNGYIRMVETVDLLLEREDRNRQILIQSQALLGLVAQGADAQVVDRALGALERFVREAPLPESAREAIEAATDAVEEWSDPNA